MCIKKLKKPQGTRLWFKMRGRIFQEGHSNLRLSEDTMMWKPTRFFIWYLLILNVWLICASKSLGKIEKANNDEEMDWVPQVYDLSVKTLSLLRPFLIPKKSRPTKETTSGPLNKTTSMPINEATLPVSGRRKFDPWGGK